MRIPLAVLALGAATWPATAQDHEGCPMKRQPSARQAEVDHRHQHTTGLPSAGTRHQFRLAKDGGSIRLEATDPSDRQTRDAVRTHLQHIARAFTAGDFSMPMQIHDQTPPGAETMKARRSSIRYSYGDTDGGGLVTIATRDPEALAAVHEFLRFQIRDHGTGQ
jgi:hypothetical protein